MKNVRSGLIKSCLLVMQLILSGCTLPVNIGPVRQERFLPKGEIDWTESIAFVELAELVPPEPNVTREGEKRWDLPEGTWDFLSCLHQSVQEQNPPFNLVSQEDLRSMISRQFGEMPRFSSIEQMLRLLGRPEVKRQLNASRVRYLVAVSGAIYTKSFGWGLGVAEAGTGGGAKETELIVIPTIVDIEESRPVAKLYLHTVGESAFGAVLFVPAIFVDPGTQALTCRIAADWIIGYMTGDPVHFGEVELEGTYKTEKLRESFLKTLQLANCGEPEAQFEVGRRFETGGFDLNFFVIQSHGDAAFWYGLAAKQGHVAAAQKQQNIMGELNAELIADIERRIATWIVDQTACKTDEEAFLSLSRSAFVKR